ncbi:VOC family protein [Sphingomonas alpina]|uniref:VOC family protein n=1 Tax=Sphingomonas alpina TaxID=653931 RepID=A0A7H0LKM2_9SPHN|nr:VOC family protein [Sphingomonas alpina]QNQ10225.1 VOC family protein [Sphingomonas alpina]
MTFQQSGAPVTYLNVSDRERALGFYRDTLGLTLRSSDDFGDFIDFGGGLLRMTAMPDHKAHPHPVLGWNVEDIGAAVVALRDRGITFSIFEGFGQDALGIWTSPDGKAKIAFFADPDGNVLTLSEA